MPETISFTPLEEMTHHLDSKFEAWNMQGEVRSTGTVDIPRLEEATATAMEYHPLASARRRSSSTSDTQYEWVIPDDPEPLDVVEIDSDEVPLQEARNRIYGSKFDLTEEAPVRIYIYRGGGIDGGDHILQSTSHVAGDGLGTLRFSQAVWTAYKDGTPIRDPVSLADSRQLLEDIQVSRLADAVQAMDSLARRAREAITGPTEIAEDGATDREGFGYAHRYIDAGTTARLVSERPTGISVNDVLMAALHLAIAEWNADHGKVRGRQSVLMPVNLRPQEWFNQVMAMYSMFESVRTGRGDRRDEAETIREISRQTSRIKERDRAEALYKALTLLPDDVVPVSVRQQLPEVLRGPGQRLADTAILTNLGNIPTYPTVGDDTEDEPIFSPPAWRGTPVGLGVATLDNEVNLMARYMLTKFDADGAGRFMDTFADTVEHLVDGVVPSMEPE
jgi:NRPS condensation-like uncharacterized protein